jgi:hypothetical protein
LHCPECGQHSGQFIIYCEGVSGPIYEEVPGKAKLVQTPTQTSASPTASAPEIIAATGSTSSEKLSGPLLRPWYYHIPLAQIVAIAMLVWALIPANPYSYYVLLRFAICGISSYLAYKAFELNRAGLGWVLAIVAVAYNPIVRVHLDREIWSIVNIATIAVLMSSIWARHGTRNSP